MALGMVRTYRTIGAIHKGGQKNNKQARKGLSVSHGEEIRHSVSPVPVLWAGAGCPQLPFAMA